MSSSSSSSSAASVDPQGWVTTPPSTLVKIRSVTSRPALNGCLAVVLQYAPDRQRYVVHTTVTQEQVSLKADNLQKASWTEQMMGQYQLLRHDPRVQRQLQALYHNIQTRTGGNIKPEYVGVAALFVVLAAMYMIGFTRVMMIMTAILLLLTIIGEDLLLLASGGGGGGSVASTVKVIVRNAPNRFRTLLRQQIPFVGPRIADSPAMSAAVALLLVLLFVRSMMPSTTIPIPTVGSSFPPSTTTTTNNHAAAFSESLGEKYYKLGFDDATANLPFGASLTKTSTVEQDDDSSSSSSRYPDFDFDDTTTTTNMPRSKPSSPFSFGNLMSAAYLLMTMNQLGKDPVTGQFSIVTARQNLTTLSPYQMGMIGLSVYKLVSAFL